MAAGPSLTHYQAAARKRRRVAAGLILLAIPALIGIFVVLLHQQFYLPVSFLILALTICPFLWCSNDGVPGPGRWCSLP